MWIFKFQFHPTRPRACVPGEGDSQGFFADCSPGGLHYFPSPESFVFYFQHLCTITLLFSSEPSCWQVVFFLLSNLSVFLYIYLHGNVAPEKEKAATGFFPAASFSVYVYRKHPPERIIYSSRHSRKQTIPTSGLKSGTQGTHNRAIFSFVWEQMVPLSAQPRVGKEEGVRRNKWCCNPVFFLSQGSMHPTLPAAKPRKGADSLLEGSTWDPWSLALGFPGEVGVFCIFPNDLEVLSDESFVVILFIPSS